MRNHSISHRLSAIFMILVLLLTGPACTLSLIEWPFGGGGSPTETPSGPDGEPTPIPVADFAFEAVLREPLSPGESLALSVLDEVTGLPLNPVNYPMEAADSTHYRALLPIPPGSVVKYRYLRLGGATVVEDSAADRPVRYRLLHVSGPGGITDQIASWADRPYNGPSGIIQGQVKAANGDRPLPNILVAAGGMQAMTDSQGNFSLRGLPPGTHNLVAYSLDGSYRTFQQGAEVGDGMVTPVSLAMQPAPLIKIHFTVSVPKETVAGAPLRLAGNLAQLGNTFADLRSGLSTLADRMPVLMPQTDGTYTLTLDLPAGADVRYKYTLGDGFWNAEHRSNGPFMVRQLVVPESETFIHDTVQTWQSGPNAPIVFDVTVPANTPPGDVVYIQFNPFGWTEPIPMWPLGNNRWVFKLFSPLNMVGNFGYRLCRNAQCGSADDSLTVGPSTPGRSIGTSLLPENIQVKVEGWQWLGAPPAQLVAAEITSRGPDFVAGIEMQPDWDPTWQKTMPTALQNLGAIYANWAILTPTWTFQRTSPPVLSLLPGPDALWPEMQASIGSARALNLNVALFPTPNFPQDVDSWWISAPRDLGWWNDFFDQYRTFLLNHAEMAARYNAQAIILGGAWLDPALPGGILADGTPSGVPAEAESRWRGIIADVRARFQGRIWWAQLYPGLENAPTFLGDVDGIYLLWSAALSNQAGASKADMQADAARQLDEEVLPWKDSFGKPLYIAIDYPSALGAKVGCIADSRGGCLDWSALSRPNADLPSVGLDLQGQADIYEAMLAALNARSWVNGFISRGYYPPAILQDKSSSVHGKPAADVLWYWFPRILGITQ